jgi:hypothetical protein
MALIGIDDFTEGSNTALDAHTPDTAGSANGTAGWTLEAANFDVIALNDDVRHSTTNLNHARKGDDIGDDDMDVVAQCKVSNAAGRIAGVCGRMDTDGFANQYVGYMIRNSGTTQDLKMFKTIAGTPTQIGTEGTVNITLNADTYIYLKLEIRSGVQILYTSTDAVTWTPRINAAEADSVLSGRRYAGIIMNGNATVTRVDTFRSYSVSGVSLVVPPPYFAHLLIR